ncbi:hypothetical protein CY35_13G054100 [Sphagnum magellanicum]|nr:hypothetical protein CY35_13G054100 [Sphagnum magellanicum]
MTNYPHHNGVVKWKNKTILEREICLALESNTPTFFWIEMVYITNYLININPSKKNVITKDVVFDESMVGLQVV